MVSTPGTAPNEPNPHLESAQQGQEFIAQVQHKIDHVVQEFAAGKINRAQFQRLYDRYQRQIATVSRLMASTDPAQWRDAIGEIEDTLKLKKRYTATPLGLSIYDNRLGSHIQTLGEFRVERRHIAPMLHSYRMAASEAFHAGARSTEMENGQWLCFVPGGYTTLIALFSLQPSDDQLETIERMHEDFEEANSAVLEAGVVESAQLVYPFYTLMQHQSRPPNLPD